MLPEFCYPFPSAINPRADVVHRNTVDWMRDFGLIEGEAAYRHARAGNIGRLAGRFHPTAPEDALQLVSDWYAWMFFRDDQHDEARIGERPGQLVSRDERFVEVLRGERPLQTESSMVHALSDLRERMLTKISSRMRMRRFTRTVREHFESGYWEARNRARGSMPELETYVRMRPVTGGLPVDTEFIELTEGAHLPSEVRTHPVVQRMSRASDNVVCWVNDIVSLEKEMEHGDVHNLIPILRHELGLSLQEAVDHAAAMHDEEVRAFMELEPQVPAFGKLVDDNLKLFVSVLRARMRGYLDWVEESDRYNAPEDAGRVDGDDRADETPEKLPG